MEDLGAEPGADMDAARPGGRRQAPLAFGDIVPVTGFGALADPQVYVGLPDDWIVGLSDVVDSTTAIEAGRYKAVNMAGAAVISAVANALGRLDFPFSFGGDGASFAVPPEDAGRARDALAATVAWVGSELGLELRGATLPVASIRAAGQDIRVARFAVSPDLAYAMFSGGGRAWAERQLKSGAIGLPPAPPGARPDLTGLSCRFKDMPAANGVILSMIVRPREGIEPRGLRAVFDDVLRLAGTLPRGGHPVPAAGPALGWSPTVIEAEARLSRPPGRRLGLSRMIVAVRTALLRALFWSGVEFGGFVPGRYLKQLVENSDIRKFDDGLMMTLDCSPEVASRIETRLRAARAAGLVDFGLYRQASALVTCMVPSALRPDHIHFVDGAAGGYALAARDLKSPQA